MTVGEVALLVKPNDDLYAWTFLDQNSLINMGDFFVFPEIAEDFTFGDFNDLFIFTVVDDPNTCLLYTSPSPRDRG